MYMYVYILEKIKHRQKTESCSYNTFNKSSLCTYFFPCFDLLLNISKISLPVRSFKIIN